MRALTRNEPLERHNLPDSAPGVVVDGAGSTDANGIYVRTGFKVANTEVFQKRGTCLVMLKRGEDLNWSLINLNGLRGKSDKAPKEEAISSGVYTFSPAKLRWNPNSTTLYQVAPSLHSRDNLLPPHVGWTVVDGLSPAPSVNFCTSDSLRPEKLLAAAIPGKLLTRIAETAPTVAKVQTSIHQAWRTDAQQTLPRILRWGTSETSRARKQVKAKGEGRLVQTLSLPDLRSPAALLMPEGETVMVIYSLVIGRPSFHFEWGLSFQEKELRDTGRRIVAAVEPNSPFDRWNIWQLVRGRPEMCVRAGDQLLKQSGAWAYFECPLESSEGYEDLPSITESETLEGVGDTLLVLDFGRFERRPCPPEPPRLEPWEAGYGLRVEIDSNLAGPYQEDVIAWALVLKEDLSEAAFVSTTPGKLETCWRAFDGESGKVHAVLRDAEVGAIMHNGGPITLHLSEGIKTGRTYAACLAVLTAAGWSAFSYPSRPVHVKQRPGLMDGILSLVLPPEDEQHRRRKHLTGALFYFLPSDLQAGFSAPITTQSTVSEPCELFSTRRLLKLSLVLPHGRPKGLEVSEEGGSTLYVVDEGRTPDAEARVMKISNHAIPWRLCSGDFIVRLNGFSGAERMLEARRLDFSMFAHVWETGRSFRGASTAKWGSCGEFTCAETYVSWRPCQCNSLCKDYENCCSDYQAVCVSPPTPAIQDPVPSPPPASPTPALPDTSEQPVPVAVAPAETTPPAPANVYSVNVTALPWTWKDGSLNSPSASPLFTFYMYRAVSDEVYPPLNTNVASLPGVLWYLHHEVVIQAPRKFQISRILRYKVQMRATAPLLRLGMHFGVRLAYDKGQATGPFVCGRTNITNKDGTTEGYKPKFCGDGAAFKDQYLGDLKPYKNEYEYAAYGYNVGCNNLGEYPFPMHQVYYPNAIWYTMPGACPNNLYFNKDNSCQASQPGGYCPGVEPNGNGTCTWNYEEAGEVSLDELVGIKDYASWRHSHREYDPETDEGIKFSWWNGINSTTANEERVRQAAELFDRRYPSMPTVAELRNPPCDFDFGSFYKEWYRKDGYVGPCGPPNANCKGGIGWIRHEGLSLHPKWYVPLTDSASDDEIQRLLYQLGKNECLRPCERGETPIASTPSTEAP
eukprot:s1976_g3.t1